MALSATFSGVTKVLRACEIVSSLEGESSGAMRSNALIVRYLSRWVRPVGVRPRVGARQLVAD